MILLEYESKKLLEKYAIPIPKGDIFSPGKDFAYPSIAKSQVPIGERGKHGGIRRVENKDELADITTDLFHTPIKGYTPSLILIEEALEIKSEYYLSLFIDHATASIRLMLNKGGGIEVENNEIASFLKINLTFLQDIDQSREEFEKYLGASVDASKFIDFIKKLSICMLENDALLVEINPLAIVNEDKLVAVDCKMELDNNAAFRHPDWNFEEKPANANFVTLNPQGNIATIANGAGLAMATVDAVANMDMLPANFLDIGGGANEASVTKAFKAIATYENIQAIVINIFAGITRCDEVAKAIVGAKQNINDLPPLFIRLDGTNYNEAKVILDAANIELLSTLEDCLIKAKGIVS